MPVNTPGTSDTRSRLADWIEIQSLIKPRQVATRADFSGVWDILDDSGREVEVDTETGDRLETEILEGDRSFSTDQVFDELEFRADVLKEHYPFELNLKDHNWHLSPAPKSHDPEIKAARISYLFCLLISAVRDGTLPADDRDTLSKAIPHLFQEISAKAACGLLGGHVISFGWPRPDGSTFHSALKDVSKQLKLGKPLESVPLWSKGQEKDAGIDVIAWRDFPDKQPGKMVLFGQVASGNDWTEKPIKNAMTLFWGWFSRRPTEHFIPAIFIPFPQHHGCTGRNDEAFGCVADSEAWRREQQFGLVIDRLRIAGVVAQHLVGSWDDEGNGILSTLNNWISDALVLAKA